MHIAICDDNVADRKQSERLLGREADKWIAQGNPIYIYSYGSVTSLIENAMRFDAILLDVSGAGEAEYADILSRILAEGMDGAIIYSNPLVKELCDEGDVFFLPKPINASKLHESLVAISKLSQHAENLIELRGIKETLYVREEDIIYGIQSGDYTLVTLTEGRSITVSVDAFTFYEEVKPKHEVMLMATATTVVNAQHVSLAGHFFVIMSDGKKIRSGGEVRRFVKHRMNR